jgi:hypothetical protein
MTSLFGRYPSPLALHDLPYWPEHHPQLSATDRTYGCYNRTHTGFPSWLIVATTYLNSMDFLITSGLYPMSFRPTVLVEWYQHLSLFSRNHDDFPGLSTQYTPCNWHVAGEVLPRFSCAIWQTTSHLVLPLCRNTAASSSGIFE